MAAPVIFPCFDGLRAIAALLVILVHVAFQAGVTTGTSVGDYTARGEIGVAVFFVISGFLLYRPFVAARFAGRGQPDGGAFLIRRFLRIFPLYWVALLVTLGVANGEQIDVHGFAGLVQCLFLVQGYQAEWTMQGLAQAWTLDVEIAFYLSLPLYAWLLGRRSRQPRAQLRVELLAVAGLFVVGKVVHRIMIPTGDGPQDGWGVWLPVWWDLFALGMVLAIVSAWYVQQGRNPTWANVPGFATGCWAVAAFFYWIASKHAGLPIAPVFDPTVAQDMGRHLYYGLFGLFLVLPAVFGDPKRGWVRPLLASRPMAFLGLISYGLYLWHAAVIELVVDHSGWALFDAPYLPFFLLVFGGTVAVSTATYFLVERPCMALSRDWARRWRERQAGLRPREDSGGPEGLAPVAEPTVVRSGRVGSAP